METPLVTCITPTKGTRPDMLRRCIEQFKAQDYQGEKELCIADSDMRECLMDNDHRIWHWQTQQKTVGGKRNELCQLAKGEIILSWDDDDFYSSSWITRSVQALGDKDTTGLRSAYFYDINRQVGRLYTTNNPQPYAVGATMCYRKRIWEANPFQDVAQGEDTIFMTTAGWVVNHDYIDGFTALIHGNNTCSHKAFHSMRRVDRNKIPYVRQYERV